MSLNEASPHLLPPLPKSEYRCLSPGGNTCPNPIHLDVNYLLNCNVKCFCFFLNIFPSVSFVHQTFIHYPFPSSPMCRVRVCPPPLSIFTHVPGSCLSTTPFTPHPCAGFVFCPPLLFLLTRVPGSCFVHHSFHSSPVCRVRVF